MRFLLHIGQSKTGTSAIQAFLTLNRRQTTRVSCSFGFASALALALHELATNSAKYGALSAPGGRVRLDWTIQSGDRFEFIWQEDGGPPVVGPTRAGFGTRMIERALFVPFQGHATIKYDPSGVRCRVVATLPEGRS
jgi:two-component sensor histidine kinase